MKDATRRLSLGVILVGVLIGSERASEAGFINYSLSGHETVGLATQFGFIPTAFDPVSISMTVDTSTITNDPALSNFSPGYITGTALATVSVSDATYGELTTTIMAHATVSQVFASVEGHGGYFTEVDFIADSGPSLGSVIGRSLIEEVTGNPPQPVGGPLPVTYDLKSPYGPVGVDGGGIFYEFQTSGVTFELGGIRPDNPNLFAILNFQAATVPEPSSLALCGIAGIAGLVVAGARRSRHA